jgi:hypothetical protein
MILSLGEQLMTASTLVYVLVSLSAWMLWNLPFIHQLAVLGIPYTLLLPQLDTCDSPVQFISLICLCFHFITWGSRVAVRPAGFLGAVEDIMRIWLLISIPVTIIAVYKICSRPDLVWSLIAPYIRPHLSLVRHVEDMLRQYMAGRCPHQSPAPDEYSPSSTTSPELTLESAPLLEPEPTPLLSREAMFRAIEHRRKRRVRPVIIIRQTGGAGIKPDGPEPSIPRSRGTQTENVYRDRGVQTKLAASSTEEPATLPRMHREGLLQQPRAGMVSCSTQTNAEGLQGEESTSSREPVGEGLISEPEVIHPDAFTEAEGQEDSNGLEAEGSYITAETVKYESTALDVLECSHELEAEEPRPYAEASEPEPKNAPEELKRPYDPEGDRLQFESAIDGVESMMVPEEPKSSCALLSEGPHFESSMDEVELTITPEESENLHKLDGVGFLIEQLKDWLEPVAGLEEPKDSREPEGGRFHFSFELLRAVESDSDVLQDSNEQGREEMQLGSIAEEHFEHACSVELPASETSSVHDPISQEPQAVKSLDALPPLPFQDDTELVSLEMGSEVAETKRRPNGLSVPSPSTNELPYRAKHSTDSPPEPELPTKRPRYEVTMDDGDVLMAEFAEFPAVDGAADNNEAMSVIEEDIGERMADVEYEEGTEVNVGNVIEMSIDVSDSQQLPEDLDAGMSGTYEEADIDHVDFNTEAWAYPSFLSVDNQNSPMVHQELGTHTEQQDIDYYMSDASVLQEFYPSMPHGQQQGHHAAVYSMGQGQKMGLENTQAEHWDMDVSEPMLDSNTLPQPMDALPMSDDSRTDTPDIWQEQIVPVPGYVTPSYFLLSSLVQKAVGLLATPESSASVTQPVPPLDVSQSDSAFLAGNKPPFPVPEERVFTQEDVDAVLTLLKEDQSTSDDDPPLPTQSRPVTVVGVPSQSVESRFSPIEKSSDDEFDERPDAGRTLEEILEEDDPWLFEEDPPDSPISDAVGSPSAQSPRSGLFDSGHVPEKNMSKKHWLADDVSSQPSDSSSRATSPVYQGRPTKIVRLSSVSGAAAIDAPILEGRLALGQCNLLQLGTTALEDISASVSTEPQTGDSVAAVEPTTVCQESQSAAVEELDLSEEERDIVRLMDEELPLPRSPAQPTAAVVLGRPEKMTPSVAHASLTETALRRLYDITPVKPNSDMAKFDSFAEAGFHFQSTEAKEAASLEAKRDDWAYYVDEDRRAAWADRFVAEHDGDIIGNISGPAEIARRQIVTPKARFGLNKRRAQVHNPGNAKPVAEKKVSLGATGGFQTDLPSFHHSRTAPPPQSTVGSGNGQLTLEAEANLAASVVLSPEEDIYSDDRVKQSQRGSGGGVSEAEKPPPVLRGGLWMPQGIIVAASQTPVLNGKERESAEDNTTVCSPTTPGTDGSSRASKLAVVRKKNHGIFMAPKRPLNQTSSPAARSSHANAGGSLQIMPAQMGQDIIRRQEEARKAAEEAREGGLP